MFTRAEATCCRIIGSSLFAETPFDLFPDSYCLLVSVGFREHDSLVDENFRNRNDYCWHVTFRKPIHRPVAGCERLFRPLQFEQVDKPLHEGTGDKLNPLGLIIVPEPVLDLLPDRERFFVPARLLQQVAPVCLGIRDHREEFDPVVGPEAFHHFGPLRKRFL